MSGSSDAPVARAVTNSVPFTVPGRRPDPLASIRLHRWLALLTGSLLLIAGVAAALMFGQHEYEAEAQVEVSPTFPDVVQGSALPFNSDEQYHEFVEQQVAEIDSYATTSAALKLLGMDRWVWQERSESDRRAAERLIPYLEVNPISNTYLISVALTGYEPEGVAKIVNAVVTAYLQRERRREAEESDQRVRMMVQHRVGMEKDIEKLRAQEGQLARELGVSGFGVNVASPYDKMLGDANEALDIARRATIEAQAHLEALTAEEQRLSSLEVNSTAQQMVASDSEAGEARAELIKEREAKFLELQQLGPDHPGRPALQAEMDDIDDELAQLSNGRAGQLSAMLRQSRKTEAQRKISNAQSKVDQAHRTQDGIQKLVDDLRARAASFGSKYSEAMSIDANLVRDNSEIQQIDEQIGELRIHTQSAGFVSLESSALTPDMALKGKRRKIFTIFLAAALVMTIGLPLGLDMIDPLIKSPDELEAIVGFPPFGAMLGSEGRAAGEALRRIALGIIRECRASGTRSFVLTPVGEGTVSRTLALVLADELNSIGIRTAAIESHNFTQKLTCAESRASRHESEHRVDLMAAESTRGSLPTSSANHPYIGSLKSRPSISSVGLAPVTERESDSQEREEDSILPSNGYTTAGKSQSGKASYETAATMGLLSQALPEPHPSIASYAAERDRSEAALMPEPVRGLLDKICKGYDVLLFDAPPILVSADAEMLIEMPAGAILVVRSGHDVPRDVRAAAQRLERIAPPVVGTVMTYLSSEKIDRSPLAIVKRWLAAR